jgi:hypothetical protein
LLILLYSLVSIRCFIYFELYILLLFIIYYYFLSFFELLSLLKRRKIYLKFLKKVFKKSYIKFIVINY